MLGRRIGPVLAPDDIAPNSGIGPVLPESLVRAQMARRAEEETARAELPNVHEIGPLLPGNEIIEELRHAESSLRGVRSFSLWNVSGSIHRRHFPHILPVSPPSSSAPPPPSSSLTVSLTSSPAPSSILEIQHRRRLRRFREIVSNVLLPQAPLMRR